MDRPLIIKVRCEETLKRVTAYVSKQGILDLELNQLRAKVRFLFEIPYDVDFKLRYIDEDGDEITLFENCDLCEAITQRLDPFCINLVLYEKGSKRSSKSSASLSGSGLDLGLGDSLSRMADKLVEIRSPSVVLGELVQSMSKVVVSSHERSESVGLTEHPKLDKCCESQTVKIPITRKIAADQLNSSFAGDGLNNCVRRLFSSRFVFDLNDEDFTRVLPNATLSKILKLHNNGARAWPHKSRFVWIGGDQLADQVSVETEIPVDGLPAGEELDVALSLKAPKRVGRYTCYWRMCLPSGEPFGQQIWLTLQVYDPSEVGTPCSEFPPSS